MGVLRVFALAGVMTAPAAAVGPDYFPLHQGNQWIYRCSGSCAEPLLVTGISKSGYFNGKWYSLFDGFGGRVVWLRQDGEGVVWALDPATGRESRWYAFSTPEGQTYDTNLEPCSARAKMESRAYGYAGTTGMFPETLRLSYSGPCADAGLTEEIFHRWTGLMRRTETTIAGPRTWDLIYARTGGVTVLSGPELNVSLTLDKSVYTANLMPPVDPAASIPKMTARLTVRNTTSTPVTLVLPDGVPFCMRIETSSSQNSAVDLLSCSLGTLAPGQEVIGPGEKNYVQVISLGSPMTGPLPAGHYTVRAWLTKNSDSGYSASAGFEVRHVY